MGFGVENLHLDIGAYLKGLSKLHEVPLHFELRSTYIVE